MVARLLPVALAACAALAGMAPGASAGELTTTCRSATDYASGACRMGEAAASNVSAACRRAAVAPDEELCATPLNPAVSAARVDAYEGSWTHRTLLFQHELGNALPFLDAPWVGTHNSANTATEDFTLSGADHNQQLSMRDQLRLGVRSLEIDLHYAPHPTPASPPAVVACHGRGADQRHAGCTNERLFRDRLPEVAEWLRANPREVVLLYLEDHLVDAAGHTDAAATLQSQIGDLIYTPSGGGCRSLPLSGLTRDDVLAAGKQVVLVDKGCGSGGAWRSLVFDFGRVETEGRPVDYSCASDPLQAQRGSKMLRYYEDSTVVSAASWPTGASSLDDGLTPETTAEMVRCGIDLLGFDQILPDDGRLDALVWSWRTNEPSRADDCAALGADGRWIGRECAGRLRFACRTTTGGWTVSGPYSDARRGADRCKRVGAAFDPPRTGAENVALAGVAKGETVWIGVVKTTTKARGTSGKRRATWRAVAKRRR